MVSVSTGGGGGLHPAMPSSTANPATSRLFFIAVPSLSFSLRNFIQRAFISPRERFAKDTVEVVDQRLDHGAVPGFKRIPGACFALRGQHRHAAGVFGGRAHLIRAELV